MLFRKILSGSVNIVKQNTAATRTRDLTVRDKPRQHSGSNRQPSTLVFPATSAMRTVHGSRPRSYLGRTSGTPRQDLGNIMEDPRSSAATLHQDPSLEDNSTYARPRHLRHASARTLFVDDWQDCSVTVTETSRLWIST